MNQSLRNFFERFRFGFRVPVKLARVSLSEILSETKFSDSVLRPAMASLTTDRVARILPGFGSPNQNDTYFLNQNIALSGTAQQSNTLPSTASWTAPFTLSYGWLRVKIYNGIGTSPTLVDLLAILNDYNGNAVQIAQVHPNTAVTLSSTSLFDQIFPFFTGATGTSITIKTTLGGTSPGATMDTEVAGGVASGAGNIQS